MYGDVDKLARLCESVLVSNIRNLMAMVNAVELLFDCLAKQSRQTQITRFHLFTCEVGVKAFITNLVRWMAIVSVALFLGRFQHGS